jgi:hypothetical protein
MEETQVGGIPGSSLSEPFRFSTPLGADAVEALITRILADEPDAVDGSALSIPDDVGVVVTPSPLGGWEVRLRAAGVSSAQLTEVLHRRVVPVLVATTGEVDPGPAGTPRLGPPPGAVAETPAGPTGPPPGAAETPDGSPPDPGTRTGDPIDQKLTDYLDDGRVALNPPGRMALGDLEHFSVRVVRSESLDDELVADLDRPGRILVRSIRAGYRMKVTVAATDGLAVRALSETVQVVATTEPTEWQFTVRSTRAGPEMLWVSAAALLPDPDATEEIGSVISLPVLHHPVEVTVTPVERLSRFVTGNWKWLVGTALTAVSVVISVLTFLN